MGFFNFAVKVFNGLRSSKTGAKSCAKLYKQAAAVVDSIPESRWQQAVESLFKPQGSTTSYFDDLEKIRKAVAKQKAPKEVQQAVENIQSKAASYVADCEEKALSGQVRSAYHYTDEVKEDYWTIMDYAEQESSRILSSSSPSLEQVHELNDIMRMGLNLKPQSPFDARIGRLKDGILPQGGILYHGTKQPRTILRSGFTGTKSNQVSKNPREFGAGVYLTPDRKVASHFAGIRGRIMYVTADVKNTAAINDAQFDALAREAYSIAESMGVKFGTKEGNATMELIVRNLFKKAGYDSAYTSHGMASGLFAKSSDEWLGKPQAQLVVFDGEKIASTGEKTITQKIKDELLQIGTRFKVIFNLTKMRNKDPIGFLMGM